MDQVRALSAAVFGNKYRLEILAAIARTSGDFFTRELAVTLALPDNLVSPNLQQMERAQLIQRLPRPRPGDPQYYSRQGRTEAFWEAILHTYEAVEQLATAGR